MLKNINSNLSADLLFALRSMGHGDELVLVDCNFPAASVAKCTVVNRPIVLAGLDVPASARAVLSVLPLDSFVEHAVYRMEVVDKPEEWAECHHDMKKIVAETSGDDWSIGSLERHAFYERARKAFAIVQAAAERRTYGCFILTKGVVGSDGVVV